MRTRKPKMTKGKVMEGKPRKAPTLMMKEPMVGGLMAPIKGKKSRRMKGS